MEQTNIYTVSRLTKEIRVVLETGFQEIWVEGEVSNFKVYPSGHKYFSLKDENSVLRCVLFKGNSSRIPFLPEDGMHVLCAGKVSVYDKQGQYQLYVSKIEVRGVGTLQLAFEQLKAKLYKEGLFDKSRKRALPVLPMCVGVITSSAGAAVRDIINVARRRYPNIEILIRPVKVQGTDAKFEISQAIKELNEYNQYIAETGSEEHLIDVIIAGRGGGSLEDLWPFNEEIVARAIFDSKIPVASAVGHEIDYTIADFVADFRASTPSAAAELVVPLKTNLAARVYDARQRLYFAAKDSAETAEKEVIRLRDSYILRSPLNIFLQKRQHVDDLLKTVTARVFHSIELKEGISSKYKEKLNALNPAAVLDRGYSITFKGGKAVKTAEELKENDRIRTRFAKGTIESRVEF